jgi:prefoldin subunit 5
MKGTLLNTETKIENSNIVVKETIEKAYSIEQINNILDDIKTKENILSEDIKRLSNEHKELLEEEQKYLQYLNVFNRDTNTM